MSETATLYDGLQAAFKYGVPVPDVPDYIKDNLNPKFPLRPYQEKAFGMFIHYSERFPERAQPTQLLFHMATGSGKTLIMAGAMLHLYHLGYRNFIFFVHSKAIIEKTRDNFLNPLSSKYLFNDKLNYRGQELNIVEVDNFESANTDDLNIVFSTTNKLHSVLNTPRENALTYQDFEDKKIVLLSDEAHHINAETKKGKLNKTEQEDISSWEQTVDRIFKANPENYLLDFTATADLKNPLIAAKYRDKLLFDYPLKEFRHDQYSKEVKVLQASLKPFDRALQAVLLNQYRYKIFQDPKHQLQIKPVILFKSKTIPASQKFYQEFIDGIANLKVQDLEHIRQVNKDNVMSRMFKSFRESGITLANLLEELKVDFSKHKCIAVDSKNDSEEKQLIINSLEDTDNEYRAIFAVDKLNEGWDVLNLFDIVRLYNTRDARNDKPGKGTVQEAQLIGRGARYCPFVIDENQERFKRKYDEDTDKEIRLCEELYYHSAHNPDYIRELNLALIEIGMKDKETTQIQLTLKDSFIDSPFYKSGLLFLNERIKNDNKDNTQLSKTVRENVVLINLPSEIVSESLAFGDEQEKVIEDKKPQTFSLLSFGKPVLRKAMSKLPFFRFSNLQFYFPSLTTIETFITSPDFLGNIQVQLSGTPEQLKNVSQSDKLMATLKVLENVQAAILTGSHKFIGTKLFRPQAVKVKYENKPKKMNITVNEGDAEYGNPQSQAKKSELVIDLSKAEWYAFTENYGTSQEKYLVKYIEQAYTSLSSTYDEIYLLRNQKHFTLYTFTEGQAMEPDFVLFLSSKKNKKKFTYQIFIEPKGGDRITNEDSRIKEQFLMELANLYSIETVFENKEFKLLGTPLYNEQVTRTKFEKHLKDENILS
ncbi:DEAD/DEAH box helicase family protein [uncultured Christiangramia sp.]|uniref:DEAD/DEAH box helicase family protein n=1 Tax=Christiangramia sp. 3-2217-3z TaxID=3417564 RepID=UPI0026321B36|nr:DEAD/DEAH box helicase family protein [uncultured Christiangramia sp.]